MVRYLHRLEITLKKVIHAVQHDSEDIQIWRRKHREVGYFWLSSLTDFRSKWSAGAWTKNGTGLVFHSVRGSQYCSKKFRAQVNQYREIQSQVGLPIVGLTFGVEFLSHAKNRNDLSRGFQNARSPHRAIFQWVEVFYHQ